MIKTIFTIFHDFIDRLLVLIDIAWNRTSQIYFARIVFSCQKLCYRMQAGSHGHSHLEIKDVHE